MMHDEGTRRFVDFVAWMLAGLSVMGVLGQVLVVVSILAGLGSLSLVAMRWHDRLKYGKRD